MRASIPARARLVVCLIAAALAAVLLITLISSSGPSGPQPAFAKAKKGFKPKLVAGKWTGGWQNQTFNTQGTIRADVTAPQNKLVAVIDFGGIVLGCNEPGPETFTLTKGKGANHWSSKGFEVKTTSPTFGTLDVTYSYKTKTFKGSSTNLSCLVGQNASWTFNGTLSKKSFSGNATIQGAGFTAQAKLSASKQ